MYNVENSALEYVKDGFRVFPLKQNTKSGQIRKSWKKEATDDVAQIHQWFSSTDYNVGVRTGDGLVVIDIDNKNDKSGYESIKPYLKKFPPTRIVKTPNNGWHLYYRVNRPIPCKVNLYEGIDVRGEGGYVVGAESKIDKMKYYVSLDKPIAEANDFVYEFLTSATEPVLEANTETLINEGQRNDYLFKVGCSLQQKGISDDAIRVCLNKENEVKCHPPLNTEEVEKIILSILKYKKGFIEIRNTIDQEGRYTVAQLLTSTETDEPDIVEDMISIGVALFAAPQKCGKTFLGLQLADAIASGSDFLGKKVQKRTALYLAFEDKKLKIRNRLKTMGVKTKENFIVDVLKPDPKYDLEKRIQEEIVRNPDLKLVVVDTFQKIRWLKERDYETEYSEATYYHELGYKYNLAIVLVTHVKKEFDHNNPFDAIYGSRGLMAGSDSVIVMYKKNHLSRNRQMAIQGKDIPDDELTLALTDNFLTEITDVESDDNVEENLIKVVNYVVDKKSFTGSHEELSSKLSLGLTGRQLQALLERNRTLLESTYIKYEKPPRKNVARKIVLTYFGENEFN